MFTLILCLGAPLVAAPLIALGTRRLFAVFIRESAEVFLNLEMHKTWSMTLGTDVAIINTVIFTVAWWITVGLNYFDLPPFAVITPLLVALVGAYMLTRSVIKSRLHLQSGDAWLVGLLSFAGGNLPLIVLLPLLLIMLMSQTGEVTHVASLDMDVDLE